MASVNFKSSDRSKATVDKNGYVTPLQKGNCKITISITDNHHTTKEKEIIIHIVE
ncbi:MAG: Ig-like domain-containing protein [Eggerthia catenaformis]|uniref:Ig-like domain-containing protein n=1 Tax=Eggerthia catenaformis TaxID=31973 RepID=UPI003F9FF45F